MQVGDGGVVYDAGEGCRVLGVRSGPGQSECVCTLEGRGGVRVIDLDTANVSHSWAIKEGGAPSQPVACIGGGERLVMVCEDGAVLSWRAADKDLSKAKAIKKGGSAASLIAVDPALDGVVLLGSDGRVRLMSADLKAELASSHLQQLPAGAELVFAELLKDSGTPEASFLLLAVHSLPQGGAWLSRSRVRVHQGSWSFAKAKSGERLKNEGSLLGCSLSHEHRLLSLVWEGGGWLRVRVPALGGEQGVIVKGSSVLSGMARPNRKDGGIVVQSAGHDFMLAAGRSEGGGGEAEVFVHDLVYGSLQGQASLSEGGGGAASGMCEAKNGCWSAVAVGSKVLACGIDGAKMTLANVLRSAGAGGEWKKPQAMRPINMLGCLESLDAGEDREGGAGGARRVGGLEKLVERQVREGNERENTVLARLDKTQAPKAYVEEVASLLAEMERDGEEAQAEERLRSGKGAGGGKKGGKRGAERSLPSQYFVHRVIQRCCSPEAKGALDEAVLMLLKAGAVSGRAEEGLFQYALSRADLRVMRAVLSGMCDIAEDCLVKCLELVLGGASKASLDAFVTACAIEEPMRPVLDHDQVRRDLIDLIMIQPREHRLLVASLRSMSLRDTLRFLKYCRSLLHMHALPALAKKMNKPKGAKTPDMTCVIDWTCAVLDAHYASLVLAPDCRKLLEELKEIVKSEAALMRSMLSLDGPLSHVVLKKTLPVKPLKDYQLDTLYL